MLCNLWSHLARFPFTDVWCEYAQWHAIMDSNFGSFDILRPWVIAAYSGLDVVPFMDLVDGYGLDATQLPSTICKRLGA